MIHPTIGQFSMWNTAFKVPLNEHFEHRRPEGDFFLAEDVQVRLYVHQVIGLTRLIDSILLR